MSLVDQINALFVAIASPAGIRKKTATWIGVFLAAAALLVWATVLVARAGKDAILPWALGFVLPPRWQEIGGILAKALLSRKVDAIVANAVIGGSLFLLSTVLLPIRERISIAWEEETRLSDDPMRAEPLWHLLLGILQSLLVFATAQMLIFAIGYSPDPGRRTLATMLSYGFLFVSCAMDLLPPFPLRHGHRMSQVLMALLRYPILTLAFGALFAAPAMIAMHIASGATSGQRLVIVVAVNVVGVLWGTLGGTVVGSWLWRATRDRPAPSARVRAIAWIILLTAFGACSYVVAATARSIERKSQLLKCKFHVAPSSVSVDLPRLGAILHAQVATTARATLEIENPTPHDVGFENTRVEIGRGGAPVARFALNAGTVRAGETSSYPVQAPVNIDLRELKTALSRSGQWDVTLWVEVAPGVEIPVYIKNDR